MWRSYESGLILAVLLLSHAPGGAAGSQLLERACVWVGDPITETTVKLGGSCGPIDLFTVSYASGTLTVCVGLDCVTIYILLQEQITRHLPP